MDRRPDFLTQNGIDSKFSDFTSVFIVQKTKAPVSVYEINDGLFLCAIHSDPVTEFMG